MRPKPPKPSLRTFETLDLDARAAVWASDRSRDALEDLRGLDPDDEESIRLVLLARLREAYLAGGAKEQDFLSAIAIQQTQIRDLQGRLDRLGDHRGLR